MKGIAATTYELFDGLSTADIKNYTTFGSEYAKARVCIDALADACVLLSENLRKHVAGGRGSERPWKVGRTYVRLHTTVPLNANASVPDVHLSPREAVGEGRKLVGCPNFERGPFSPSLLGCNKADFCDQRFIFQHFPDLED